MQSELVKLLALGGFKLHKWTSNCPSVLQNVPRETHHFGELDLLKQDLSLKTLGVRFDVQKDVFTTTCPEPYQGERDSKRGILSYISKFYDPLGLIGPIMVQAKVIMQKLWTSNTDWDNSPPEDIRRLWTDFDSSLQQMAPLSIARCVMPSDAVVRQLIGFADASLVAYGCCLYLRTINTQGKVKVELLCSKSRINPLRKLLTVPRLELNAALLLSQMAVKVQTTLATKTHIDDTYLLSDSQIVLAWLKTDVIKLQTYVSNRVRAISELTRNCHWQYVNTADNPADCLSRGLQPQELKHYDIWFHGPSFLHEKDYSFQSKCDQPTVLPELKPSESVLCATTSSIDSDLFSKLKKYSSINKMTRVLAYILRFCDNVKPNATKNKDFISATELNKALLLIVKHEQKKYYAMPNVAIGSLVILCNDNTPSLHWPMARITNIFPGKDGKVRAVEVMSANGYKHNRAITKICVLFIILRRIDTN
ncbi:pao retrotransposon peptidase domain-containing protein [Phthorimaea operculella]|nr:pao retrotransposon peptidase domain-containing protein [Phthorimaea operculella]